MTASWIPADEEMPYIGARVCVVRPLCTAHPNQQFMPEAFSLLGVDLTYCDIWYDGPRSYNTYRFEAKDLMYAFDELHRTDVAIVGYNLFNFGWRVIASWNHAEMKRLRRDEVIYGLSELLPRTSDPYDAIADAVNAWVAEDPSRPLPPHGALRRELILEANPIDELTAHEESSPDPVAALWYQLITRKSVFVNGFDIPVLEQSDGQLRIHPPRYDDAKTWAAELHVAGSTRGVPINDLEAARSTLDSVYQPYLAARG